MCIVRLSRHESYICVDNVKLVRPKIGGVRVAENAGKRCSVHDTRSEI